MTIKKAGRPRLNKDEKKVMFSFRISHEALAKIRAVKERDKKSYATIIENLIEDN